MTAGYGMVNSTSRPHAHRVIDRDQAWVVLSLDGVADTLLDNIAQVLYRQRRCWQLEAVGNPRVDGHERLLYRGLLKDALTARGAFDVPLFRQQAEDLDTELYEAAHEPGPCEGGRCGGENYATRPDLLCEPCGEVSDLAQDAAITARSAR